MVLFGTSAELIFDINLIIQVILVLLLIVGYLQRRTWKYHGIIMGIATLSMITTVLLIMFPSLFAHWPVIILFPTLPSSIVTILHVIFGLMAIAAGLTYTIKFIYFSATSKPLTCGTRTQMRIQFTIWFLA
ncbi:MAG: hypothetical protein ACFFCH_07665, partial [Promethearchaeota archaeon]